MYTRYGLWVLSLKYMQFVVHVQCIHEVQLLFSAFLILYVLSLYRHQNIVCDYLLQFSTVEIPLTDEQRKVYDTAAHVW